MKIMGNLIHVVWCASDAAFWIGAIAAMSDGCAGLFTKFVIAS